MADLSQLLDGIDSLKFLFGEPRFIQSQDPEKTDKKAFKMEDEGLSLSNRLQQKEATVCHWFYDQISPKIQNGYYRFKAQYCKQIPIPKTNTSQQNMLKSLVELTHRSDKDTNATEVWTSPEFERLLNGLVYELFFPEDLHAAGFHLFDACAAAGIRSGMDAQAIAASIFKNNHHLYAQLSDLQTLPVVRLIEGDA